MSITWWPISPAVPSRPSTSRPSITMPPPTPVPSVTPISDEQPFPAPTRASASVNARASLISRTGTPRACESGRSKRMAGPRPRQVREEADAAVPLVVDPGHADAGRGDRARPPRPRRARPARAARARGPARPRARSAGCRRRRAVSSWSSTTHLMFVPPRSSPRCEVTAAHPTVGALGSRSGRPHGGRRHEARTVDGGVSRSHARGGRGLGGRERVRDARDRLLAGRRRREAALRGRLAHRHREPRRRRRGRHPRAARRARARRSRRSPTTPTTSTPTASTAPRSTRTSTASSTRPCCSASTWSARSSAPTRPPR